MLSDKKLGRTTGALLLVILTAGIPSTLLRGLSTSLTRTPDFLETILNASARIPFVVLLHFISSLGWLVMAALLFPRLKKFQYSAALIFLILWTLSFAMNLYGDINYLSLLSLAQEAQCVSNSAVENFRMLGFLKVNGYIWSHFISLVLYTTATLILFYFFFRSKVIPRVLSVWGMASVAIVCIASWMNIFGLYVGKYPYMNNGLHMISLTVWLLVKGFQPSET